jgi:hypothetical protein
VLDLHGRVGCGGCGGGWVEDGRPAPDPVSCGVGGFGTLLGPEGTPGCWVCSWAVPCLGHLTLAGGFGGGWLWLVRRLVVALSGSVVWVVVSGLVGVWLFVECCIVDASILLW